jgi:DNA-binding HxlR family transcriptional regulator
MMRSVNDPWWEAFAAAIVPEAQKAIIDALKAAGGPLSRAELADLAGGMKRRPPWIDHHLTRLRKLNAIEIEVRGTGPDRIKYRLTERPGRGRR